MFVLIFSVYFLNLSSLPIISLSIFFSLQVTTSFRGSLDEVKNLTFGTLIASLVGLALYTLPTSKWTYVIATNYDLSIAFQDSAIPTACFGLEWGAVFLWLVMLVLAPVQLAMLSKRKA